MPLPTPTFAAWKSLAGTGGLPTNALITTPFGEGRQVCNYCGPCDMGCPRGAMSSAHVTYWPIALAQGARLIARARVREITVDRRGRANGAVYYTADGGVEQQRARVVVVACNGIGTPRLLLNSVSSHFPHGLANSKRGRGHASHVSSRSVRHRRVPRARARASRTGRPAASLSGVL